MKNTSSPGLKELNISKTITSQANQDGLLSLSSFESVPV